MPAGPKDDADAAHWKQIPATVGRSRREMKLALLDMIGPARQIPAGAVDGFTPAHWDSLGHLAQEHLLEPILHRRMREEVWPVPVATAGRWAAAYEFWRLRHFAHVVTLSTIDQTLNDAGIAYAALKGASVVSRWADPALRPMRDLDILVLPERAIEVRDLLFEKGFRNSGVGGAKPPLAEKHLPSIVWEPTGVTVEIHTRLFDSPSTTTFRDSAALLSRRKRGNVWHLDWTDTLLHVVMHSVGLFSFSHGPRAIGDVAVLRDSPDIDWKRFWEMATEEHATRACVLMLALADQYYGVREISGPVRDNVPDAVREHAAVLMLQRRDVPETTFGTHIELATRKTRSERMRVLLRRLHPTKGGAGRIDRIPSVRGRVAAYWRWIRLAVPLFARGLLDPATRSDLREAVALSEWLGNEGLHRLSEETAEPPADGAGLSLRP